MKKLNGKKIQLLIWLGVLVAVIGLSATANHFLKGDRNNKSLNTTPPYKEDGFESNEAGIPENEELPVEDKKEPTEQNAPSAETSQYNEEKNQTDPISETVLPDISSYINQKTNEDALQAFVQEPIQEFIETYEQEPVQETAEEPSEAPSEEPVQETVAAKEYTPQNPTSQKFPEFTLVDTNGSSVSLEDYKGKVVVLNFWASWCPPCRSEMPELQELDQEFKKGDNAVFLAINIADGVRETQEKAEGFLNDNGYTFRNLTDEDSELSGMLGISSIPTTIVIDRAGHMYNYILGATTKAKILEIVNEVV